MWHITTSATSAWNQETEREENSPCYIYYYITVCNNKASGNYQIWPLVLWGLQVFAQKKVKWNLTERDLLFFFLAVTKVWRSAFIKWAVSTLEQQSTPMPSGPCNLYTHVKRGMWGGACVLTLDPSVSIAPDPSGWIQTAALPSYTQQNNDRFSKVLSFPHLDLSIRSEPKWPERPPRNGLSFNLVMKCEVGGPGASPCMCEI